MLKFKEILGYISSYPIPALTGFYFIGRIRFLTRSLFSFFFFLLLWGCAIRLLSFRKSSISVCPALTILALSFPFLLADCKVRPTDTRDNIFLSIPGRFRHQTGTFHLERAHINVCSPAFFRRPFPGQLFLPPKPNGPRSIWLSTKFPHTHLQLSYYPLRLTAQGKTSSQAVIKLQNWKPSISTPSLFIFFLLI